MSKEKNSPQPEKEPTPNLKKTIRSNSKKEAAEKIYDKANTIHMTINNGLGIEEAKEPGVINRKGPHKSIDGLLKLIDDALSDTENK